MEPWKNDRYYSLNHYARETFGEKLYKISLDAGLTCPNRDGTIDTRGCIFCSENGSGDFAGNARDSITRQLEKGKDLLTKKTVASSYIAYFQAYTNTYGKIDYLRKIYHEALSDSQVKILSIATRPDCLNDDVLNLLDELNQIKPVWIELGLQTSNEKSAAFIRRGYPLCVFETAVTNLRKRNITVIVHTIIGLPSEERDGILETIKYLNTQDIQGIKLQLLHVLTGTDLATIYETNPFFVPTLDEYLDLLGKCICTLRPDITVHRITGDGPKSLLIAPLWSSNKRHVLNCITNYFKEKDIWQGKSYVH
ncbi:MAG: TIGR01212 family radical SAM protein [Eubacteriales bacterium]